MENIIIVEKDGEGYIARVKGRDDLYAFDYTPEKAKLELYYVIEMMMDIHLEELEKERKIKSEILSLLPTNYAL
ncbi:MAG: hypothetical protein Q8K30_06680 [Candidatus Gracilibacteria bacterium]|nr:hypothetical protein [Candidatus Gracilibacteria bacterium]